VRFIRSVKGLDARGLVPNFDDLVLILAAIKLDLGLLLSDQGKACGSSCFELGGT
jgi:hypothetical protein